MAYNIKVTHTAPTFKQFAEWGIQKAFPTFYINIAFHKKKKEELLFRVKITGHYYCCGSQNLEDIKISLDTYKINNNMSKEQVGELLEGNDINRILEESIKDSIKDSMIPNNPIGILEQLLIN
jgi:hypothetical protein